MQGIGNNFMQEVKSGAGGPAVCHFQRKSKAVTAAGHQPKSGCCELPCPSQGMLQLLPLWWLMLPHHPFHFGGLSQVLGTWNP